MKITWHVFGWFTKCVLCGHLKKNMFNVFALFLSLYFELYAWSKNFSMGLLSMSKNSFMLQHLLVPIRFRCDGQKGRSVAFKQYEPRALIKQQQKFYVIYSHCDEWKKMQYLFGMFMPSETLSMVPPIELLLLLSFGHIRCCGMKSFVISNTSKCGQASVHGVAFNSWFSIKRLWAMKHSAYICEHKCVTRK